ncbi:ABC transporter permease [Puerhibacterium sp. TATVAM-FAB25]|uniref:ABC transporter permease n=1 Tax=Puerhibacterium sp. TATVAM-FAB25 TaxID=3093699 RepID=UPI00397B9BD8
MSTTRAGKRTTARASRRRAPLALLVPAVAGLAFLVLPGLALVLSADWASLPRELGRPVVLDALRLSLQTATAATTLCVLLGVPLAWMLARAELPGRRVVRALVTVPLVLPPVVGGIGLLLLLGRQGLVGRYLDAAWGVTLPFTPAAVVLAQAYVALPFLVLSVEGALHGADPRYEQAAATLGAGRWLVFRRVTLPLVAPGVAAGTVLSFARALGEFGATLTFAGSFPGTTRTMPLAVYLAIETDPQAAVALALVLMAVCLVILVSLRERWLSGGLR